MNHSVNDLAQLLTQALDENFNIKNQSAVVKVVTCLEAFNITHESYREVQNTRIIKDLQALRQNKANDQVLAKRIKNLLRKWKERLAATIPSQPSSPQNISQGSSDTQLFMTQQSLSPPNSQPPRIVNGPTSFKNLLPKSQNHYQSVTSPAVPQNNIPHIHQNGGSLDSSQIVLGKRKMPTNSNDGGVEIDENSNHNRKKIMKKSDYGATTSPLLFNANSNSSSIHHPPHPHNNQQINNKLLHSNNVPVPQPQQQLQQNMHIQQNNNNINTQQKKPEQELKKRGRRKGSKGFDSTLNGNIPDFQTEIQQKIALSAGKRNKTTFELQQMLESHQNTSMSWTNGDTHDSNSLDRANFSTSSYQPPEPVYSSFDLPKIKTEVTEIKREPIDDVVQQQTKQETNNASPFQLKNELASSTLRSLTIEDEIEKLNSMLPPIDYEAAIRARFDDLNSYNENGELVECTCTFREVITYEDDEQSLKTKTNGFDEAKVNNNNNINVNNINLNGDNNKKPHDSSDFSENEDDDDDETDDFCAVEDVIEMKSPSPPPRSAVKSIFDPEYDENLIDEMVRRKPRNNLPKIIEVKIEKDAVKSSRIESMMNTALPVEPSIQQMERVPIITYECDEDPSCPAKVHFQRNPVTEHDVELLNTTYINGINGYWNGIPEEKPEPDYSKDSENIDYAKHQLWKRVVPRYNFLTLDKIPKSFDDDSPFSIPPPPHDNTTTAIKSEVESSIDDSKVDKKKVSFNDASELNNAEKFSTEKDRDIEFREWHEVMNVRSYNDEILTILPYVVID